MCVGGGGVAACGRGPVVNQRLKHGVEHLEERLLEDTGRQLHRQRRRERERRPLGAVGDQQGGEGDVRIQIGERDLHQRREQARRLE